MEPFSTWVVFQMKIVKSMIILLSKSKIQGRLWRKSKNGDQIPNFYCKTRIAGNVHWFVRDTDNMVFVTYNL